MIRSLDTFSSAGIAMAVLDVDGRFLAVNPALCELLGHPQAELLSRSLEEVTGPTGTAGPFAAREALLPDGTDRHVSERRLAGRDGSTRWARVTATRTAAGEPGAVLAILEEVTERRHAAQRVRAQRDRLEALVAAQQAVATAGLDPEPVMSVVVEHALRLTGAEGSVVEMVDGDAMVYRAAAGATAAHVGLRLPVQGSLSGLCVLERETLICLDSQWDDRVDAAACQRLGVRSMAVVPLFHAGQAVGVLKVTAADVNRFGPEDVQALQLMAGLVAAALGQAQAFTRVETLLAELDSRQEFLTAVLESTQAGIVACDELGRLTLFNETTRTWHGIDVDAPLDPDGWAAAYDLFELDGVTPLPADRIPLARALREGQVVDAEILIAPKGAATATRLLCQGRRLQVGDRVLGAVVVMHDITAAHQREDALARARDEALAGTRAKTAFLAAASHEIRTPLNGVLGTLELLDVAGLDPQQRSYVEVARRSSEALLSLLNDVLDLSKAEATRVVLKDAPFSPDEVAADVAAALASVAQRKDLQLRFEAGADRLLVGDADRLRQVLMNLVGNAVKFTSAGQIGITVSLAPVPLAPGAEAGSDTGLHRLRFDVTDSGPGISEDDLRRVFHPFEQGTQGERFGGTGLGLALSQELTEQMGGDLHVQSRLGTGSTFTLQVDLREHQPGAVQDTGPRRPVCEPDAPERDGGRVPRRLRVLVADDVEVNRMVATALLRAEGADVVCVTDGDEAVLAVRQQPFDLVLLDNRMPRMSGIDAARAIRALDGAAGRTRLVALTASASDEDRAAFRRAGMQEVLLKPVRGRDLRAALHAV